MIYLGGIGLIVLGLVIIVFGNAYVGSQRSTDRRFSLPLLFDSVLKWGMGLLCIWFGADMLLRGIHF